MKRLFLLFALAIAGALAGCPATMQTGGPPPSAAQSALNVTGATCKDIDAAIVSTDRAVLSGTLKGQDARNAVKGLSAAQAGCVAAFASLQAATAAANPAASGATK